MKLLLYGLWTNPHLQQLIINSRSVYLSTFSKPPYVSLQGLFLHTEKQQQQQRYLYKVVQIWPGLFTLVYTQISPGHIWTTLYNSLAFGRLWRSSCCISKAKTKAFPVHPRRNVRESSDIVPLILNLGIRWRWEVNLNSWTPYRREGMSVPIEQEPG